MVAKVVPAGTKAEDGVTPLPLPLPLLFREEPVGTIASVVIVLSNPGFLTLAAGFVAAKRKHFKERYKVRGQAQFARCALSSSLVSLRSLTRSCLWTFRSSCLIIVASLTRILKVVAKKG